MTESAPTASGTVLGLVLLGFRGSLGQAGWVRCCTEDSSPVRRNRSRNIPRQPDSSAKVDSARTWGDYGRFAVPSEPTEAEMYASLAIGKELFPVGLIVATLAALIREFARDRATFKSGLPVRRLLRMSPAWIPGAWHRTRWSRQWG